MFPKVEFGHLYKFAVSVGLFMLAAAVAIPWFVLQLAGAKALSQNEVEELTDAAARTALHKQNQINFLLDWYPVASLGLVAFALILIVWGTIGWRKRQGVIDQRDDVLLKSEERTLERMGSTERQEKLEEAADELLDDEFDPEPDHPQIASTESGIERQAGTPNVDESSIQDDGDAEVPNYYVPSSSAVRFRDDRTAQMRIREAEFLVFDALSIGLGDDYSFERDIKVSTTGADIGVDLVAIPRRADEPTLAINIKLAPTKRSPAVSRLRDWLSQTALAAAATRPFALNRTEVVGILILVEDREDSMSFRILEEALRTVRPAVVAPIAGILFELDHLRHGDLIAMMPARVQMAVDEALANSFRGKF